ncbi:hypothetical protein [Desertibacillus haloalkaliphilus]|uniref:hypothetical protein n=1 Tax=Desertibacillus haloalkaliphilus TaxID=1328930 RepID=UPI001C261EAB|nr:hypothetical protein [Desertibacillus haloalkaliphilus]MBU8906732.1 hypothetical protein [Desertibacillus haloalkaliphilus]
MNIQDAIYNWLSIKVVADARPDDDAARDTYEFFDEMLTNDLEIEKVEITQDDVLYYVHYWIAGEEHKKQYPIELIDALLDSINAEPKYNE